MISKSTWGSLILTGIVFFHSYIYYLFTKIPEVPQIEATWWGKGLGVQDENIIQSFKIEISQRELQDLMLRLNITRVLTPSLERTQHEYGLNPQVLYQYLEVIKTNYSFTERLEFLNQFPQYTTQIQGLKIHFLHIKPDNPKKLLVLPILLLHGWPSSVREFYEMVPTLTTQTNDSFVFELIIPSLPGFGYSSAPQKPNCRSPQMAHIFYTLMRRLNLHKFYVHGSDWGAIIATDIATLYPEAVLGFHSNFCLSLMYRSIIKTILGSWYPPLLVPREYEDKVYPLLGTLKFYFAESGYFHIQGTKPDTVGAALDNSLEGILSFILEKFSVGSNKHNIHIDNAGLDVFDNTTLLDTILFYYWFPKAATTSARIYTENLNIKAFQHGLHNVPVDRRVPCGCSFFENEFVYQPESILRDKFVNLIHYSTHKYGGHFAALEETDLLARDIISFVSKTIK